MFTKRLYIHPEDKNDMLYWTRKWNVDIRQIHNAILETGSLNLQILKDTIKGKRKIWLFFKK